MELLHDVEYIQNAVINTSDTVSALEGLAIYIP